MTLATTLLVLAVLSFVVGCFNPKWLWWHAAAWRYQTPEANEPSVAGYRFTRWAAFVAAAILAIAAVVSSRAASDLEYTYSEVLSVVDTAAVDLDPNVEVTEPDISDVERALAEAGDADRIRVKSVPTDTDSEKYEVTNEDGRYPVCLTFQTGGASPGSATVDDGHC